MFIYSYTHIYIHIWRGKRGKMREETVEIERHDKDRIVKETGEMEELRER